MAAAVTPDDEVPPSGSTKLVLVQRQPMALVVSGASPAPVCTSTHDEVPPSAPARAMWLGPTPLLWAGPIPMWGWG